MPTLNMTDQVTPLELARRANAPEPYKIIELMRLKNEMLIDIPAYECNSGTIHKTTQRTIGPMGEHRIYNQGVGAVATQTKLIEDRTTMLGAYSRVDEAMLQHSGNRNAVRQSEAVGIIKGMGLTQAEACVNADKSKVFEFDGLKLRRNKVDNKYVFSAGGAGNKLTSIYIVAAGPDLFHFLYPQGSKSIGVERQDLGVHHVPQADNPEKSLPMAIEYFTAQYGICVRDPSALIRICNIPEDISGDKLIELIIEQVTSCLKARVLTPCTLMIQFLSNSTKPQATKPMWFIHRKIPGASRSPMCVTSAAVRWMLFSITKA